MLIFILALTGCFLKKDKPTPGPGVRRADGSIVTPARALRGKILQVNAQVRFVVMGFPLGRMPALETRLNVYRQELKVGEIKVTGPQRDDNIVGDVISGEAQVGDEVRDN